MWGKCVCVFSKLHITAQPGPVKLTFQCYSNGSALWGISVVRTATTTSNKPRQRGDAIEMLSLATTYFYFIYLLDPIVTSFVVLYRPPRNNIPILPSILAIDVNNTSISTRFLSGTRDLLLLVKVADRCPPLPFLDPGPIITVWLS